MAEPTSQEQLSQFAQRLFRRETSYRSQLERVWYRNLLYLMGEQWIKWSVSRGGFVPEFKANKNQPRPVDNIIRENVHSLKALILNKDFETSVWPNSNDYQDRKAAKLGEDVLRDINAREDYIDADIMEEIALWTLVAGTGFCRDYFSKDKGIMLDVGEGPTLRTGDIVSENVTAFNVFVDDYIGIRLRDKRYLGIQSLKSKDWIAERFPQYTKDDSGANVSMINYQRKISRMVVDVSPWRGVGVSNSVMSAVDEAEDGDYALYQEIEFAPTKQFQKGRYVVMVGKELLADEPRMPNKVDKDGRWCYSLEDFRAYPVPGRFWGDSPINDMISPQDTINRVDHDVEQNREGIGKPFVLGPVGVKIKRISDSGAAVRMLTYDPAETKGNIPAFHNGIAMPAQIFNERKVKREAIQDIAGNPKNILAGKAPGAGASGIMVDILRETTEQSHAPDVHRFYRARQRSYRKRLLLAQDGYTEDRLIKVSGPDGRKMVKHFKGSDLRGNTDVRLEITSGVATTNAGKAEVMKGFIQAGVFDPRVVPPEIRVELFRKIHMSGFKDKVAADLARAEEENAMMANGDTGFFLEDRKTDANGNPLPLFILGPNGQAVQGTNEDGSPAFDVDENGEPPWVPIVEDRVFELDDHEVHAESHRRFIISNEFDDMPEHQKIASIAHYEAHLRRVVESIQAQRQAQMADQAAAAGGQVAAGEQQAPAM